MTINQLFLGLVVALFLQSCGTQSSTTLSKKNLSILQQANQLIIGGNPAQAAQALINAANQASGEQRQALLLRAASAYLDAGKTQNAMTTLQAITSTDARIQTLKKIETARLQVLLGNYQQALALLPNTQSKDPNTRSRQFVTAAAAHEGLGNIAQAIDLRLKLDAQSNLDNALQLQNQRAIWRIIGRLDSQQRNNLAQQINNVDLPGWLLLANAFKSSDRDQALNRWRSRFSFHPAVSSGFIDQISNNSFSQSTQSFNPDSIALLLPMTGGAAAISEQVSQGATGFAQQERFAQALFTIDTQRGLQNALDEASTRGAKSIIGPLTKSNVAEIMSMSGRDIPVIALNDLGVAANDGSVIQFGLTPENEADDAAAFARNQGLSNAFILVPNNSSGDRLAEAFRSSFVTKGGNISGIEKYDPSGLDFTKTIKPLSRQLSGSDMIFMPARRQPARLLGAQLKFFKIYLPVISTSRINEAPFDARLDRDILGLMFNEAPAVLQGKYPNIGNESARLRAFGADAVRLAQAAPSLIANPQQRLQGDSGSLSVDAGLRVIRTLDWVKFSATGLERIAFGNRR